MCTNMNKRTRRRVLKRRICITYQNFLCRCRIHIGSTTGIKSIYSDIYITFIFGVRVDNFYLQCNKIELEFQLLRGCLWGVGSFQGSIFNNNCQYSEIETMLKIFGKNTNQLLKKSSKTAYSMPQTLKYSPTPIRKCACGYDFIALIGNNNHRKNSLFFLHQGSFYPINEGVGQIFDIAVSENLIAVITLNGEVMVWQFDEEKVRKGSVTPHIMKIQLEGEDSFLGIHAGGNDIFLNTEEGKVYHFRKNQWYETKSYSNIQSLELSSKIVKVSTGPKSNLFLTYDGQIFESTKQDPLSLHEIKSKETFIEISCCNYGSAISKKGTIYIWGSSPHGNFSSPTQFAKLTKKFIDIKLQKENGFALSDDGEVWCWGRNQNGELGLSDYEQRLKPFPMVTLDKYKCLQVFCGQSFTVCLCEPTNARTQESVRVVNRRISGFEIHRELSKKSLATFVRKQGEIPKERGHKKQKSSSNLPKTPKNSQSNKKNMVSKSKSKPKNISNIKLPSENTPKHLKKNSGISPNNKNKSSKKIKQPIQEILRQNNFTLNQQPQSEQSFRHIQYESSSYMIQQNQQLKLTNQSLLEENRNLQEEIDKLNEENTSLREKNNDQTEIIDDITLKIRLLEEAIDEYEKDLTARDNILEEQQKKEKAYVDHIEQLQKSIDEMIRNKERNSQITVIYEDLERNFEKQRSYYVDKIKEMEAQYHSQLKKYQSQIQRLKGELSQRNKVVPDNKENQGTELVYEEKKKSNFQKLKDVLNINSQARQWSTPSPILKAINIDSIPSFNHSHPHVSGNIKQNAAFITPNQTQNEHNDNEMEQMIMRIESSKTRIKQSADKLFTALDINN